MEISQEMLARAKNKGKLILHDEEIKYSRFREGSGKIPRGTVLIGERIIFGFPHIKRIFTLQKGLEKNITEDEFYIEEKIDGFNVRAILIDGKIFAFSRGGFVDPFVTEKVREIQLEKFFSDYPNSVLCGEMIGRTPYTRNDFEPKLLVFDIMNADGEYVEVEKKYEILKNYKIDSVPTFGRFTIKNMEKIKQVALKLMKEKKEGMVIKSRISNRCKYVNPFADIHDIIGNARIMFDMPSGFFIQRVLRSAMFIRDFKLDENKYAKELGSAFYGKLIETLKEVEKGKLIAEEFEISIKDVSIWNKIVKHMGKEIKLEKISEKKENGKLRIKFRKIYKRTNQKFREFLSGKGIED
ncbi:MAG: RNA ligase [Candidatus Micrarchaeota archaeon]|nr:RNA ligase [Candidatus Micrarchaeota archaeon]